MTTIKTSRLIIKKPGISDRQTLITHLNNWEIVKWLSRVPSPYLIKDADWWINNHTKEKNNLEYNIYLNKELVGGIGFQISKISKNYILGFWLAQEYWNKGYMTEACKSFLNYMIKKLQIKKIKAGYFEHNKASAIILKKFGFNIVGNDDQFSLSINKKMSHTNVELLIH